MDAYTAIETIKRLKTQGVSLFTLSDFARLFAIDNRNTLYKKVQRLEEKEAIKRLIKGKYLFLFAKPNEFVIANFLYQPSYVSLESALSLYGIITGFPYQITSITIKKTNSFTIEGKEYHYTQIAKSLFWGYEKKEDFLIAEKEKSLFDYLYLAHKGLREFDAGEFDLSLINKKILYRYLERSNNKAFLRFVRKKL